MRFGGPVFEKTETPEQWVAALKRKGYSAAYCPVTADATDEKIRAYADAAAKADIIIAEVPAWSNPISPLEDVRAEGLDTCIRQLRLAEKIGANCCVDFAGSRATQGSSRPELWYAPHPDNFSEETFALIVSTFQHIIDTVKPQRTAFTLETMPWIFPDSPDNYLRLIEAINRPAFAVHCDPVNLLDSPRRYFNNGALIREFFAKLGTYVKSCHAKDITLTLDLTVYLKETPIGTGALDYHIFLEEVEKVGPDTPLMLEHLKSEEEFDRAAEAVRAFAREVGVCIK